jgi:hypothetical protein
MLTALCAFAAHLTGGIVVLNFNRDLPSTKQSNADADNPE